MSIDELVRKDNISRRVLEKVKHYAKYSTYCVTYFALKNLLIPTRKRRYREMAYSPVECRDATILEETIYNSTQFTIPPMQIIYAIIEPRFLAVMAATNAASLLYETVRTRRLKREAEKKRKEYRKRINMNDHQVMKRGYLWEEPPEKLDDMFDEETKKKSKGKIRRKAEALAAYTKDKLDYVTSPRRWWRSVKRFGRRAAVQVCSYALISSLAFGHLMLTRKNEGIVSPSLVNFRIESCTLDDNQFYLLEEMHYYNASSSEYMRRFIDYSGIDVLLSEGVGYSGPEAGGDSEMPGPVKDAQQDILLMTKKKTPNISETLLFVGLTPFILGAGCYKDGPSDICIDEGIPIVYLERARAVVKEIDPAEEVQEPQSGGDGLEEKIDTPTPVKKEEEVKYIREGLSEAENTVLGVIGGFALVATPYMYTYAIPFRYAKFPDFMTKLDRPVGLLMPGLLHERNQNMVDASAEYLLSHPNKSAMVRIGAMHAEGMKELYAEKGEFSCVPFDVKSLDDTEE